MLTRNYRPQKVNWASAHDDTCLVVVIGTHAILESSLDGLYLANCIDVQFHEQNGGEFQCRENFAKTLYSVDPLKKLRLSAW